MFCLCCVCWQFSLEEYVLRIYGSIVVCLGEMVIGVYSKRCCVRKVSSYVG